MDYEVITAKASHDSMNSGSNGLSTSPSSNITDEVRPGYQRPLTPTEEDSPDADADETVIPTLVAPATNGTLHAQTDHVIRLSSIEHCMPRAYIRVCLAYPLPADVDMDTLIARLNKFARRIVDSKPYLSGYIVPAADPADRSNVVELRFSDEDFYNYPDVQVRHLSPEEVEFTYDELNEQSLPPSVIRPELVSALPEGTDDEHAPVFRMQANVVRGGFIVSIYLHHCVSDGVGLGFLITGKVLADDFTFNRHLATQGFHTPDFHARLSAWCGQKYYARMALSWSFGNQISNRNIKARKMSRASEANGITRPPGRGCVLAFSKSRLEYMKDRLDKEVPKSFISPHDALRE